MGESVECTFFEGGGAYRRPRCAHTRTHRPGQEFGAEGRSTFRPCFNRCPSIELHWLHWHSNTEPRGALADSSYAAAVVFPHELRRTLQRVLRSTGLHRSGHDLIHVHEKILRWTLLFRSPPPRPSSEIPFAAVGEHPRAAIVKPLSSALESRLKHAAGGAALQVKLKHYGSLRLEHLPFELPACQCLYRSQRPARTTRALH